MIFKSLYVTDRAGRLFVGLAMVLATGLASCAGRPESAVLHPVPQAAGAGKPTRIFVATQRKRSDADDRDFTAELSSQLSFQAYTVSVPAGHVADNIEWPEDLPGNPLLDFVVTSSTKLDQAEFDKDVVHDSQTGDVIVFVHGFNTSYEEAVYRAAQMKYDTGVREAAVVFAWPSRASVTGYVADRERVTYSRDYLERTLDGLARTPGLRRIHILAHSMGNWLVMETLRQAKIRANSAFWPKLGEVLLMSPDIDINVFRSQLDVIGKRNPPIRVAISNDDDALAVSQWLAGNTERVGNALIDNAEVKQGIQHYGLDVINMSDAESPDALNHSKFLKLLPALNKAIRREEQRRGGTVASAGQRVFTTTGAIVQAPFNLGAEAFGH